jgi:diketogulonate reductase-like aldo/keto reductase
LGSEKRIDEAVAAVDIELTSDDKKYLEELYQPRSIVGHM